MKTETDRPRGSKEIWLAEAYDLLICDGIDAVKIMPLAKRLNLSRTGFYWFFQNIAELHAAMVARWERKNTGNLVAKCELEASSLCEALFNLMDCWLDPALFDAQLDLAIRNWARVDEDVQARIKKADKERLDAVAGMFLRHGASPEQAEVRSMTVIYTQVGYISMEIEENREDRIARVPHYVAMFAGEAPDQDDIDTFLKRHAAG